MDQIANRKIVRKRDSAASTYSCSKSENATIIQRKRPTGRRRRADGRRRGGIAGEHLAAKNGPSTGDHFCVFRGAIGTFVRMHYAANRAPGGMGNISRRWFTKRGIAFVGKLSSLRRLYEVMNRKRCMNDAADDASVSDCSVWFVARCCPLFVPKGFVVFITTQGVAHWKSKPRSASHECVYPAL